MGESYVSDVFVSMANGEVSNPDATTWDIAIDVRSSFSVGIRTNDGHGVELKTYPSADISGWDAVDTTGLAGWPRLTNQADNWESGAFNVSASSDFSDFSWGLYTGEPLHDVEGDSLYIITSTAGMARKIRIDLLDGGEWTFTYANIDGTNEVSETFLMEDHPERNFIYYDLDSGEFVDREPSNLQWDLTFTRYFAMTMFGPGTTTGCLANDNIGLIKASGVDVNSVFHTDYEMNFEDRSIVGSDWKFLNDMFEWEITPDECYFIQDQLGDIYKLIFTDFGGTSTGDISYTTELVSGAGINDNEMLSLLQVYPNPISNGQLNIVLDSRQAQQVSIQVLDLSGKVVLSQTEQLYGSMSQIEVDAAALSTGVYVISISTNDTMITEKIVVR